MKTVLITGAASGIGAATARLFHRQGWQVGLLDINPQALALLAAELNNAWHTPLDVTDAQAAECAVSEFCNLHNGQLRLLFNGAGILRCGHFEDIGLAEHARILQINVQGLLNMTHVAFPFLRATANAQVINMGSASGHYGVPHLASYSASKFAVRGLTEALDLEWAKHGIRVADLMPPFVSTPMLNNQLFKAPILRRLGVNLQAEAVAKAAWLQTQSRVVHRPISLQFNLLYWFGQLTPPSITRRIMAWLSRE
jgi:NAD(P)-dependent dehydrogenase (short-subunit alcohol dehydrogenase family)